MWIRTQDKKRVLKIKGLELNDLLGLNNIDAILDTIDRTVMKVAEYSTKEKAIKVITNFTNFINSGYADSIYIMPQDSEVKQ